MRDPKERLRDILEAISAMERYADWDRTVFEQDELLQSWFLRHLQIIGEAARSLPEEVQRLAPEIPWTKIIGMRNILVHGYFEIDTDISKTCPTASMKRNAAEGRSLYPFIRSAPTLGNPTRKLTLSPSGNRSTASQPIDCHNHRPVESYASMITKS